MSIFITVLVIWAIAMVALLTGWIVLRRRHAHRETLVVIDPKTSPAAQAARSETEHQQSA
jgi:hypothetical protein